MASPALLQSTSSSFHGQCSAVRFPALRSFSSRPAGVLSIRAAGVAVSVEKLEAEKVHRLKTIYRERIVPVLLEEFSYTNILQVSLSLSLSLSLGGIVQFTMSSCILLQHLTFTAYNFKWLSTR